MHITEQTIIFSKLCLDLLNEKEMRDFAYDLSRKGHNNKYLEEILINDELTFGEFKNLLMKVARSLGFNIGDISSCVLIVAREVARNIFNNEEDLYKNGKILSGLNDDYFDYPDDPFLVFVGLISVIDDSNEEIAREYYKDMKKEAKIIINWTSLPCNLSAEVIKRHESYVLSL